MEKKKDRYKTNIKDRYKADIKPLPPPPKTPLKIEPLPNLPRDYKVEEHLMPMKKAKYNSKLVFPKGDLGVADDKEMSRMFPRKIKNAGKEWVSSKELPYRGAGPMEKDRGM